MSNLLMDNSILEIILRARDEASAKIAQMTKSLEGVKKGADIVNGAILGMSVAIAGASVYSVKLASDFESAMTLIQTSAGASSQELAYMHDKVLQLSVDTGTSATTLANALYYVESAGYRGAKAFDILKISAQGAAVGHTDVTATANALTTVLNSGVKGVNDASQAMGAMNAIVGQGKMKLEDLNAALSSGILASAKSFGLSLQDVGGALDTMTNNGVPAIDAATRLRMMFSLMEAPTSKAQKALESIGLTQRSLADDMRSGGLNKALEDLNTHLNGTVESAGKVEKGTKMSSDQMASYKEKVKQTQEQIKILNDTHVKAGVATERHNLALEKAQSRLDGYNAKLGHANTMLGGVAAHTLDATEKAQLLSDAFGGGRESATILTLLGNTKMLGSSVDGITKHTQDFNAAWKKTQEDNDVQIKRLIASVQLAAIQYGQVLLPAVTKIEGFLATNLVPTLDKVTQFVSKNKVVFEVVAGVIASVLIPALVAYQVQMGIKNVAAVLQFIATEWKAIAGLVAKSIQLAIATGAFLVHTAVTIGSTIATTAMTVATWALNAAMIVLTSPILLVVLAIVAVIAIGVLLITHWKQVQDIGGKVFNAVGGFFTSLGQTVKGVVAVIIDDVKNMVNSIIDHINGLIHGVNGAGSKIGLGAIKIPDIPKFENGGYVPKTGLAIVHQGEFVLSKAMLAGQKPVPTLANKTYHNTPITINAEIHTDIDMGLLANKIAFAVRNSR